MKKRINQHYNNKILVSGNDRCDVNTLENNELLLYSRNNKSIPSKLIANENGKITEYKVGETSTIIKVKRKNPPFPNTNTYEEEPVLPVTYVRAKLIDKNDNSLLIKDLKKYRKDKHNTILFVVCYVKGLNTNYRIIEEGVPIPVRTLQYGVLAQDYCDHNVYSRIVFLYDCVNRKILDFKNQGGGNQDGYKYFYIKNFKKYIHIEWLKNTNLTRDPILIYKNLGETIKIANLRGAKKAKIFYVRTPEFAQYQGTPSYFEIVNWLIKKRYSTSFYDEWIDVSNNSGAGHCCVKHHGSDKFEEGPILSATTKSTAFRIYCSIFIKYLAPLNSGVRNKLIIKIQVSNICIEELN